MKECFTLGAVSLHWGKLVMKICRLNNDGGGDHDGGGERGPDGGELIRLYHPEPEGVTVTVY